MQRDGDPVPFLRRRHLVGTVADVTVHQSAGMYVRDEKACGGRNPAGAPFRYSRDGMFTLTVLPLDCTAGD